MLSKSSGLFKLIGSMKGVSNMSSTAFTALSVTVPKEYVYHVKLNRPDKRNAINNEMWMDIKNCFEELSENEDCRAIVLSGEGKVFTAGVDFSDFMKMGGEVAEKDDVARKAKIIHKSLERMQVAPTSLELCKKPVLAAIHSACCGVGVDLVTAADIRYCTKDAWFQIKEVIMGLAPDIGTLQRFPKIVGSDSLARELSYTARKMYADEALSCGLVSRVFGNHDEMLENTLKIAEDIAKVSPVAVQATKLNMVYSRDHTVQEGLDHVKLLNQFLLQSEDVTSSAMAVMTKDDNVKFSKL